MSSIETVRVKISSEAAGAIAITQVVTREMPVRDLIEELLAATGKDEPRIVDILRRGTFVSGASRLRWEDWTPEPAMVAGILATFPDPAPERPFDSGACTLFALSGGGRSLTMERAESARRRLFRGSSFWDRMVELRLQPAYRSYSYRLRADEYAAALSAAQRSALRSAAVLLKDRGSARLLGARELETVTFWCPRGPG